VVDADAPPGWRRHTLRAAGLELAVFETGAPDGPPVLLLHGLGLWTSVTWDRLVARLDPRRRYVALDLPGFGASEKPDARYDTAFFRHVLEAAVPALGAGQVALVGHSLGGLLAADFAGAHPDRVRRLVLLAPAGFAHPRRHLALAVAARLARPLFMRPPRRALIAATLRGSVHDPASLDAGIVEQAQALGADPALRRAFARVYAAGLPAFASPAHRRTAQARYARYGGPVLCAWGRRDRYLPIAALAIVRRVYPQARTLILEHSGHLPTREEPAALATAIDAFLS